MSSWSELSKEREPNHLMYLYGYTHVKASCWNDKMFWTVPVSERQNWKSSWQTERRWWGRRRCPFWAMEPSCTTHQHRGYRILWLAESSIEKVLLFITSVCHWRPDISNARKLNVNAYSLAIPILIISQEIEDTQTGRQKTIWYWLYRYSVSVVHTWVKVIRVNELWHRGKVSLRDY